MKKQNISILTTIALAASIAAGASTASAAGLLGQRYVGATLDYVFWDNDTALEDGLGVTVKYNQPLNKSIDLSLGYSYLSSDIDGTSASVNGNDINFGATWFTPAANGKFFTALELGWFKASSSGVSDSTTYWEVAVGYEFPIGASASATPYVSYGRPFDSGYSGTFEYGIIGEFEVGNGMSLLIGANGNDDSDFGASAGFAFRF